MDIRIVLIIVIAFAAGALLGALITALIFGVYPAEAYTIPAEPWEL